MKSLLPLVLVILALTGAIAYSLAKRATKLAPQANMFGIGANQLESFTTSGFKLVGTDSTAKTTPTLTPTATPTISVTPTATPKIDLPDTTEATATAKKTIAKAQTTKTSSVCTPVYGMANTCTEHVVVDTGAADSVLFNLAGLSYFAGLVSFIKAKAKR